jgi:hypothetical protein
MIVATLQQLEAEVNRVRQLAKNYPFNPIPVDVWFDGAGYSNLAQALTQHFKAVGWLKSEEMASLLWAKVTLVVMSHYHHSVGPAMLASADCQERLGNTERAALMYTGVVKDFVFLLENYANTDDLPNDQDRIALECLEKAVERLLSLGTKTVETIDLSEARFQLTPILSRPITS